jgi:hypothetical protein
MKHVTERMPLTQNLHQTVHPSNAQARLQCFTLSRSRSGGSWAGRWRLSPCGSGR